MKLNSMLIVMLVVTSCIVHAQNTTEPTFCKWFNTVDGNNQLFSGYIEVRHVVNLKKSNQLLFGKYLVFKNKLNDLQFSIFSQIDSLSIMLDDSLKCNPYFLKLKLASDSQIIHYWKEFENYITNELKMDESIQLKIKELLNFKPDTEVLKGFSAREKINYFKTKILDIAFAANISLRYIHTKMD